MKWRTFRRLGERPRDWRGTRGVLCRTLRPRAVPDILIGAARTVQPRLPMVTPLFVAKAAEMRPEASRPSLPLSCSGC